MVGPKAVALERAVDEGGSKRVASPQPDELVIIEPSEMADLLDSNRASKEGALLEQIEGLENQTSEIDVIEVDN